MDAVERISLYSTLFYISLVLCVIGLLLAVAFFFLFDIRKIYTQITGHGKERQLQRAQKEKTRTGRQRGVAGVRSEDLYTAGITGGIAPPPNSAGGASYAASAEETTALNRRSGGGAVEETAVLAGAGQAASAADVTTLLKASQPVGKFEIFESVIEIHTDEFIES